MTIIIAGFEQQTFYIIKTLKRIDDLVYSHKSADKFIPQSTGFDRK
jgi:hypothetical protein